MNLRTEVVLVCFFLLCNKSYPTQLEKEELVGTNGTNASFSLGYLKSEFENKKLVVESIPVEDSFLTATESVLAGTGHSLVANGVISSKGLSDTGQVPVVVTLLDSAPRPADLVSSDVHLSLGLIKNKTRPTLPGVATHNDSADPNTETELAEPPGSDNSTASSSDSISQDSEAPTTPVSPPGQEDIPSFREWTQKQLAEAEKKKGENLTILAPAKKTSNAKIRSKNYASLDCGAKIVGANPEAKSANSVLSPSRDEYILSPCTSKIWFVVELCESIQAKKIELANFELFSSSPRDFTVSVADRYITKDWTVVGQFTARDERTVQNFPLSHSLFAKYMKLEFHSHYGAEHFCPVSLLKVFGTSELDILDSDAHDDHLEEDDEEDEAEGGEGGNNIFGSARDAVISIVKKAAEVLTPQQQAKNATLAPMTSGTSVSSGDLGQLVSLTCSSPAHIIVCDNCTDELYHRVYWELSCQRRAIEQLFQASFIERILRSSSVCASYGLHFVITPDPAYGKLDATTEGVRKSADPLYGRASARKVCTLEANHKEQELMKLLLPESCIAALCNHLAILENKVVYNTTSTEPPVPTLESPRDPLSALAPVSSDPEHQSALPSPDSKMIPPSKLRVVDTTEQQFCTVESSLMAFPRTSNMAGTEATLLPADIRATQAEYLFTGPDQGVQEQIRPTKTLDLSDNAAILVRPIEDTLIAPSSLDRSDVSSIQKEVEVLSVDSFDKDAPSAAPDAPSDTLSPPSPDSLPPLPTESPPVPSTSDDENVELRTSVVKVGESGVNLGVADSLERLFSDLEAVSDPASTQQPPPPAQLKESVLIRLANRIKCLERNMSLSTQYLDELSRRYKRQIEELSRSLAATLAEAKRGEAREAKLQAELSVLASQLTSLTIAVESVLSQSESWTYKISAIGQHTLIIVVELLIFIAILFACRILPEVELSQRKISLAWRSAERKGLPPNSNVRRKSDSALTSGNEGIAEGIELKNRGSAEAMMNSGSSVRNEINMAPQSPMSAVRSNNKAEKRRKRRKKEVKLKISSSFNALPRYSSPSHSHGRLKRTSSSDQISWCPDISIRNAFEPLTTALQSPQPSPPEYGNMFTTAMDARRKRSLNQSQENTTSQNFLKPNPVRKNSQGSNHPARKISQGETAARKNSPVEKTSPVRTKSPGHLSLGRGNFGNLGNGDRSPSNSSSNGGTPKKTSGFRKYVKKFF